MVHRKYIKKGDKVYGPYFYESYRENGRVKKRYVHGIATESGSSSLQNINFKKIVFYSTIFALIALVFFFGIIINNNYVTGRVALNIENSYTAGEMIDGNLKLSLRYGELLPINTKVIVNLGDFYKEFLLSDLIDSSNVSGNYYAENTALSGSGEGYGIAGKKIIYPEVDFELKIKNSDVIIPNESAGGSGGEETPIEQPTTEEPTTPEIPAEEIITENPIEETPNEETPVEEPTITEEQPTTEETSSETPSETIPAEENTNSNSETPADSGSSDSSTSSDSSESSSDSGSSGSDSGSSDSGESGGAGITGAVIGEDEYFVSGKVSKGDDFSYNLESGQIAEIVSGSVKVNGTEISNNEVSLDISNSIATVSTDYSIDEEGFGSDYLGNDKLELNIDLGEMGINATEGTLSISLVYGNEEITSAEGEVNIQTPEIMNETNATLEENITEIVNETIENVSIILIQNIPTIRLNGNNTYSLDLGEYFSGAERYSFDVNNVNGVIDGNNLTLSAEDGFRGARKAFVVAYAGNDSIESNEFTILVSNGNVRITTSRERIEVGQPVKWKKEITLENAERMTIELPKEAEDVVVKKVDESQNFATLTGNVVFSGDSAGKGFFSWLFSLFRFTGYAVSEGSNAAVEVVLDENATQYTIEYTTPAPTSSEENSASGKEVTISGPDELNYTNVIASANLSNRVSVNNSNRIKVYWRNYNLNENVLINEVGEVENEIIIEDNLEETIKENITEIVNEIPIENNETIANNSEELIVIDNSSNGNDKEKKDKEEKEKAKNGITGSVISDLEFDSNPNETLIDVNETLIDNNETLIEENATANETSIINNTINPTTSEIFIDKNGRRYKREEMPFDAYDIDGDGKVDYIEWVVPHLSNQTFEIIEISKAEWLDENKTFIEDIYDKVYAKDGNYSTIPQGDYVRVTFEQNLTNTKDITLYARARCEDNSTITINGTEIPCEIYMKKLRLDALRRGE